MKEYAQVFSAMILDVAGGTLTTLLILRISVPYDLGVYSRILSLGLLASSLAILGIDVLIRIYVPRGEDVSKLIGFASLSLLAASIVLSLITPLAGLLSVLSGAYVLQTSRLLALRRYRTYLKIVAFRRIPQPIIVPITFYFFGPEAAILALSFTFLPSVEVFRYAKIGIPKGLSDVLLSFLNRALTSLAIYLDKVVIGVLYGYEALGVYFLVRQMCSIVTLPVNALDRYGIQELSSGKSISREFLITLLLVTAASIALRIFRSLIGRAFPNYSPYLYLLRVPIPYGIFRSLSGYERIKLLAKKNLKAPAIAQLAAMISALAVIILSRGDLVTLVLAQPVSQASYLITIKIIGKLSRRTYPRAS